MYITKCHLHSEEFSTNDQRIGNTRFRRIKKKSHRARLKYISRPDATSLTLWAYTIPVLYSIFKISVIYIQRSSRQTMQYLDQKIGNTRVLRIHKKSHRAILIINIQSWRDFSHIISIYNPRNQLEWDLQKRNLVFYNTFLMKPRSFSCENNEYMVPYIRSKHKHIKSS